MNQKRHLSQPLYLLLHIEIILLFEAESNEPNVNHFGVLRILIVTQQSVLQLLLSHQLIFQSESLKVVDVVLFLLEFALM